MKKIVTIFLTVVMILGNIILSENCIISIKASEVETQIMPARTIDFNSKTTIRGYNIIVRGTNNEYKKNIYVNKLGSRAKLIDTVYRFSDVGIANNKIVYIDEKGYLHVCNLNGNKNKKIVKISKDRTSILGTYKKDIIVSTSRKIYRVNVSQKKSVVIAAGYNMEYCNQMAGTYLYTDKIAYNFATGEAMKYSVPKDARFDSDSEAYSGSAFITAKDGIYKLTGTTFKLFIKVENILTFCSNNGYLTYATVTPNKNKSICDDFDYFDLTIYSYNLKTNTNYSIKWEDIKNKNNIPSTYIDKFYNINGQICFFRDYEEDGIGDVYEIDSNQKKIKLVSSYGNDWDGGCIEWKLNATKKVLTVSKKDGNVLKGLGYAFYHQKYIETVKINSGITKIGNKKVFVHLKKIKKVYLPKSVKSIKKGVFRKLVKGAKIYIPKQNFKQIKNIVKKSGISKNIKIKSY